MTARVGYSPLALSQLEALYAYISKTSSFGVAASFVGAIVDHCDGFDIFPQRGTQRDDIRPGLRISGFRRRVTIAFTADQESVTILGTFYGGQDYEAILRPDE